ncbi:MAG: AAA family ATPase, partial [Peptococcaceae bacterium]|nr:AAA family ATPase [Peptococcaceae bacterium]
MTYTIAVAGKGGVGKTSFCALLMRWLIEHRQTPVLAVDADPNSNLAEALGLRSVEG